MIIRITSGVAQAVQLPHRSVLGSKHRQLVQATDLAVAVSICLATDII